ncbi:MAG: division/cell wall cluster transcriptional repressor MraZ [Betaproteobacteria bacterium]|nr:division/cell wall cluster transcriptional repressor MraZ [Betaproteobacteria bacterium]
MFQGAAALSLDAKGRLTVPSRHRDTLQGTSSPAASSLVLTAHPDGCLLLYPASAWEPMRARVMGFPALDARFSVWKRLLVGFAEEVEIDAAWRVLISPELRKFATLEKQVMLVGQGSHFEIWNQDIWEKQLRQLTAQTQLPPGMEDFAL